MFAIEFLGEIEPHEQGSWLKACPLANNYWTVRSVDFDGFCAGPNAIGLALKSVQEFRFSHNGPQPRRADGTHERERAAGSAGPSLLRASREIKATIGLS